MNIDEEKKIDAEKCLQVAATAFAAGKPDKAERLLLKAERLYPTSLSKQMLDDIKVARGIKIILEPTSDTSSFPSSSSECYYRSENDEKEAERCIEIAQKAIENKELDRAKRFLLKSIRIFPNEIAKDKLKNLGDEHFSFTTYRAKQVVRSQDEADKCIERAEAEMEKGRLGKAERLLKKAERLCPSIKAKDLLSQVEAAKGPEWNEELERKESRQPRQQQNQDRQQERPKRNEPTPEQIEAIERVKGGRNNENLGLDDKFPTNSEKKANRKSTLLPTEQATENLIVSAKKIQEFLEKTYHNKAIKETKELQSKSELTPEEKFDQRKTQAIKCVNIAETAMSDNNIEKAERFLTKAIRLHPSKATQDFSETIRFSKENRMNEEAKVAATPAKEVIAREKRCDEQLLLANSFVESGINAYNEDNYYAAEEWFKKANNVHPTDLATDYLSVVETIFAENSEIEALKVKEINQEQDLYLTIAYKKFIDNNLKDAVTNVFKAVVLRPTEEGYQLLQRILEAEYYYINGAPKRGTKIDEPKQMRPVVGKRFLEVGDQAFSCGNFHMAEYYFRKSEEMFPSAKAKLRAIEAEVSSKSKQRIAKANESYSNGKIKEAQLVLRDTEGMHPTNQHTMLSQHKVKQRAKENPEIIANANKEKAMQHIKKAEESFNEGDFDAAENLIVQANSIFSAKKIQEFLEKIRHEKAMKEIIELHRKPVLNSKEKFDQREQQAMKCVNIAESAMSDNNIEKAERFLTKAIRLYPSKSTQDLLDTVKEKIINEEVMAAASAVKGATATATEKLDEILLQVHSFVGSGIDAYNKTKYYVAEEWFKKANNVHFTDLATKYLSMIEKKIPASSKKKANPLKEREIIDELDIYLTMADKNLKDNNLKDALTNVYKAENLRITDKSYQFVHRILEAEYYNKNGAPKKGTTKDYEPIRMKSFKSKRLLEIGEQAFSCGNFQMAEYYFSKSFKMFPSVKAKIRELALQEAKLKNAEKDETGWSAV